ARAALRSAPAARPATLYFATAAPAYLDKTNATAIHAALDLDASAAAFDMLGSVRSGAGALRAATDAARPALVALSDIRTGLPGGADEREGGDGAVAFLLAPDSPAAPLLAAPIASASVTAEFLDRWRLPGEPASRSRAATVAAQVAAGMPVSYATALTWRGFLQREPPRRPDPERPAAPPSFRGESWKFAFTGSRCQACGARHVPPQRVCVKCH